MVVTLLSDFGTVDGSPARVREQLSRVLPEVSFADISHNIPALGQRKAAHVLANAWEAFPTGTIHLSMVFPFAGVNPALVAVKYGGHYFVAPDNGLLPTALGTETIQEVKLLHAFRKPYSFERWLTEAAKSLRQIIDTGLLPEATMAPQILPECPAPVITPSGIDCYILYADRYGNVVLNISGEELSSALRQRAFSIKLPKNEPIGNISNNYSEVPMDKPLCRINRAGYLEVAVNHGSAIEMLGLKHEDYSRLRNIAIHISFSPQTQNAAAPAH